MGLHWNAELQISGTKVPQMKHNLRQEKLYSTVTLYSDQPTHGIAPECGIHLPGVQNSQSKSLHGFVTWICHLDLSLGFVT